MQDKIHIHIINDAISQATAGGKYVIDIDRFIFAVGQCVAINTFQLEQQAELGSNINGVLNS